MKLFSVIVLAALCATAVTAAPQTTPNLPFLQLGFKNIFDGILNKVKDFKVNIQCVRDVVGQVVKDSEFKAAWDEYKSQIDTLLTTEWQKCVELNDFAEQTKCKAQIVEKGVEAVSAFFSKLVAEAKWDLVSEIKEKIVSECFQDKVSFDLATEFQASLPEQFECLVEVLGEVSKDNGLEELWSKTEPQLLDHLNKWKQCSSAGNKFLVLLCNVKEGVATYKLITEYIRLAAAENPQVIQQFVQLAQQRCAGQLYTSDGNKGAEKIKCVIEAVNEGVQDTDFSKVWEEYKKDLEKLHEHIKACSSEANKWEEAKCVAKELKNGREILSKFLSNLKKEHQETYERIKELIKKRCFA